MLQFDELLAKSCGQVRPLSLLAKHQDELHASKYVITKPYAVIGRHVGCDICLPDEQISKQHAYLQVLDGRLFCIDQGSRAGIFWRETPRLYGWINPGESIEVGPYHITLEQPVGAEATPAKSLRNTAPFFAKYISQPNNKAQLEVDESQTFLLRYQMALIGRSKHCNIVLDSDDIAPVHAAMVRTLDGDYWLVVPMGHVKVNGSRCQNVAIQDGDVIKMGHHIINFKITARPEKPVPVPTPAPLEPAVTPAPPELLEPVTPAATVTEPEIVIEPPTQINEQPVEPPATALIVSHTALVALAPRNPSVVQAANPSPAALVAQMCHLVAPPQPKAARPLAKKKAELAKNQKPDESLLVNTFMHHMKQMQQDMMTQMRMNMEMMAEFMVNLQQQQMDMVREEMAQLAKVNQELMQLRQSLLTTPPSKVEAYKLTLSHDNVSTIDARTPAPEVQREPSKKGHATPKSSAKPTMTKEDLPEPQESSDHHSHAWISKRIATLENERKTRWEKMKSAVLGH